MSTPNIRYVPILLIKVLILSATGCCFLGAVFVILERLDYGSLREQQALPGGILLILMGLLCLGFSFSKNASVTLSRDNLIVERNLFGFKKTTQIVFKEITDVDWNFFTGTVKLTIKGNKRITIPSEIIRIEGDLDEQKHDPEMPAGGPTKEMFNLKAEIKARMTKAGA